MSKKRPNRSQEESPPEEHEELSSGSEDEIESETAFDAVDDISAEPEKEKSQETFPPLEAPLWHYLGYGLLSGVISFLIWSAVPLMPDGGTFMSLLFIVVFFAIVVLWIKLLQWLAEKICGIPFRKRHIFLSLLAGYIASVGLLMITLVLPVPVVLTILLGFTLGSGLTILYFANPRLMSLS